MRSPMTASTTGWLEARPVRVGNVLGDTIVQALPGCFVEGWTVRASSSWPATASATGKRSPSRTRVHSAANKYRHIHYTKKKIAQQRRPKLTGTPPCVSDACVLRHSAFFRFLATSFLVSRAAAFTSFNPLLPTRYDNDTTSCLPGSPHLLFFPTSSSSHVSIQYIQDGIPP